MWLALPWRWVSRVVIGLGFALVGRRQPIRLLALVVTAAVVVAVVQAVQQQRWVVAGTLSAAAFCALACPLADAAVSRRSEYRADRFAAEHGAGPQVAAALRALQRGHTARLSCTARALSGHPPIDRRLEAIASFPA
jgi:STE24 endopeptidase